MDLQPTNKFTYFRIPYIKDDGSQAKFVESIDIKLVAKISTLECTRAYKKGDGAPTACIKKLSKDDSPKTGYCGHIFCSGCAGLLTDTFKQVNPHQKVFKVSEFPSDINLYDCRVCGEVKLRRLPHEDRFQLFSENKLLKSFYKALTDPGYYCKRCISPCGYRRHPFHNSTYCEYCTNEHPPIDDRTTKYTCVIHAIEHIKIKCNVKILAEPVSGGLLREPHPAEVAKAEDPHLKSIDRSKPEVIASLYHCAFCANRLDLDGIRNQNREHFQLECGHLVGSRCVHTVWNDMGDGKHGVYCIFCRAFTESDDKHFVIPSKTLTEILSKYASEPFECNHTCNALHSPDYKASAPSELKVCAWCYFERHLENQKTNQIARLGIEK